MDTGGGTSRRERILSTRDQAMALAERARAFQHGLELARIRSAAARRIQQQKEHRTQAVLDDTECKSLWEDIVSMQQALASLNSTSSGTAQTQAQAQVPSATYKSLLQAKIQRYEAEYQTLMETSSIVRETEEETLASLQQELRDGITDLDRGFKFLEQKESDTAHALEEERNRRSQHHLIKQSLEEKLAQIQQSSARQREGLETTSAHADLQTKIKTVGLENRRLMSKMATFMTKYFPTPVEDDDATPEPTKRAKQQTSATDSASKRGGRSKIATLSEFLEDLMNACMSRPHDPYISLTERHWQPYVELLLRSGIAVSHPKQPDRIKLVEFHA